MRITLSMDYHEERGAFDLPEAGKYSDDVVLGNLDEAWAFMRAASADWKDRKTGWFVSSITIDEFEDGDIEALVG